MDPVIGEILRIKHGEVVRADVMIRWQQHLRMVVAPALDELDRLRDAASKKKKASAPTRPANLPV